MTKVYILPLGKVKEYNDDYFKVNFPKRLKKAEAYANENDKLRSLGVALLLEKVLGLKESDIKYEEHGKPYSEKTNYNFSISHSGEYTALAVSDTVLGLDIQQTDKRISSSLLRILSENEKQYLKTENEKEFFKLWSLKESFGKAVGLGILIPFSKTEVLPLLKDEPIIYNGDKYYGKVVDMNNYYVSICTKNKQSLMYIEKM